MKRIAILIASFMMVAGAWAQADIDDDEPNVIGGRVDSTYLQRRADGKKSELNVTGVPIYYDTENPADPSRHISSNGTYQRPKHHYRNSLSDRYCSFFVEGEGLFSDHDVAIGLNVTYLPRRWGAYASLLGGVRDSYLTVGPALRLSGYNSFNDWHLYGGLVVGSRHTGVECGLRVAARKHSTDFCLTSGSMGIGVINGDTFLTIGLSLDIVAVIGVISILGW